ncbi:GNAT family N-acetyltransferase [Roseibium sp. SCP14]|uniref:GNAT family N-acetyltransferase n=1 Tax=Roseibium sp. SCP14 TaxID=3141375 RepID=UPI0033395961
MSRLTYPIESDRLLLRPIAESDVSAIQTYHSLEEVAKYQFWGPRTEEAVRGEMKKWTTHSQIEGEGELALAVVMKQSGELIGDVFFKVTDAAARQGTVGYTFNPAFQGKGYATEAAKVMLQQGFEVFNLHRIFARCDARNIPSWRLMERLGMRREAHFREHALFKGGWDEEFYYAILQREWRQLMAN